jgi:hypothetical protein
VDHTEEALVVGGGVELGVGLLEVVVLVVVRVEGQRGGVDDAGVEEELIDIGELGGVEGEVGRRSWISAI